MSASPEIVTAQPAATMALPLSVVVPVRSSTPIEDLDDYFAMLARAVEVIVVDGSAPDVFAAHHGRWGRVVRHVPVDPARVSPMGKVGGVLTGVELASFDAVVISDDDVRWRVDQLEDALRRLDGSAVLRPQNHFAPQHWHTRWDTGRILLSRVTGGDWPGTLVVSRVALLEAGGYRGDVLFENLELVRTVRAHGGRERLALDLLVERRPPSSRQFLDQRVRQAYDEFARPLRMAAALAVAPAVAVGRRRARRVAALAAVSVAAAELGRRRGGGTHVWGPTAALWAPLWVAERSITSWLAVASRLRVGGVRYRDVVLPDAASSMRQLRARAGQR